MRFERRLGVAWVAAALAMACGGAPKAPESTGSKPEAPAAAPAKAAESTAVAAGDFGVPECDEYFRKYMACIDGKVPEAARAMVKQSLDQTREQWKRAAATPQGKAALATGCTQATAAAKQAMAAYGCTW